jgi:hypothetical protein
VGRRPGRGWVTTDLAELIERRPEQRDRTRAIDRHIVTALLDRRDIALREKTLRRLLYESAARADEVLALNIEELDLDNKRGRITGKGGTVRWIHWQSGTARLPPRLINGRTSGPLFLADRRPAPARPPAAADLCPHTGRGRLPYERAEYLFKQDTKQHDPADAASPSTSSATPGSPTWPKTAGQPPCSWCCPDTRTSAASPSTPTSAPKPSAQPSPSKPRAADTAPADSVVVYRPLGSPGPKNRQVGRPWVRVRCEQRRQPAPL